MPASPWTSGPCAASTPCSRAAVIRGRAEGDIVHGLTSGFVGIRTFMRLPRADVSQCDIIVGIRSTPGDLRVGAPLEASARSRSSSAVPSAPPRLRHLRAISARTRGIHRPAASRKSRSVSRRSLSRCWSNPGRPVVLGGDHGRLPVPGPGGVPQSGRCWSLRLTPSWDEYWGEKYTHGTMYRRAVEEGLIDRRTDPGRPAAHHDDDWGRRTLGFATLTLRESLSGIRHDRPHPRARRRRPRLPVPGHRRPGSRLRPGDGYPGGRRVHHDSDAGFAARPWRPQLRRV
jgi:hypothetical protein